VLSTDKYETKELAVRIVESFNDDHEPSGLTVDCLKMYNKLLNQISVTVLLQANNDFAKYAFIFSIEAPTYRLIGVVYSVILKQDFLGILSRI
jgi:hypothetical protein